LTIKIGSYIRRGWVPRPVWLLSLRRSCVGTTPLRIHNLNVKTH